MRRPKSLVLVVGLVLALSFTAFGQSISEAVKSAERQENLKTCLSGSYPSPCNHGLLDSAERTRVAAAERRENLKTCLSGSYPSLCNHGLLDSTERTPGRRRRAAGESEDVPVRLVSEPLQPRTPR